VVRVNRQLLSIMKLAGSERRQDGAHRAFGERLATGA
jgi:hypothetical protein